MTTMRTAQDTFVLARLAGQLYGLPATQVAEMIQTPRIRPLPRMPEHVRGVFMLRSNSILALDLRQLFGVESLAGESEALRATVSSHGAEHGAWLDELESSVREGRAFSLGRDATQCGFARWSEEFQPSSILVGNQIRNFEEPYRRLHAAADEVEALVAAGNTEAALGRVEAVRGREGRRLTELFQQLDALLADVTREIVVVLASNLDNTGAAYCVDAVEGVVDAEALQFGKATVGGDPPSISGFDAVGLRPALYGAQRELVFLLDPDRMPGIGPASGSARAAA